MTKILREQIYLMFCIEIPLYSQLKASMLLFGNKHVVLYQ